MALRKTVVNSFSWAVMGFALTGAAYGQVAEPGITDGSIVRDGQIETETVTEAPTPAVDSAATAEANLKNNANANVGVNGLNNPSTVAQASNATTNLNPFGATFDSNSTDRLIIQDMQANSAASRLGLQAGDRIIEFNGQTYTDVNQFDRDLVQLRNGNTDIPITYERNGMRYTKSFRMSSQNPQQTYNEPTYGNQGLNNQSHNSGQVSHSAARPMYGMGANPGHGGGAAAYGNNSYQGQACCGGPVHEQQRGSGRHHGGRRHHRRCCR